MTPDQETMKLLRNISSAASWVRFLVMLHLGLAALALVYVMQHR